MSTTDTQAPRFFLGAHQPRGGADLDLSTVDLVGLGSVCRRQATGQAGDVLTALHAVGLRRLHGFGIKVLGLRRFGHLLASADSMAWSYAARRSSPLPGCSGHINCANCRRYAYAWHDTTAAAFTAAHTRSQQLYLFGPPHPEGIMTVYVDNTRIRATVGRLTGRWSHLTADTRDELHAFADRLGPRGGPGVLWHYDVTDTKRRQALDLGAQPLDLTGWRQLVAARHASPTGEGRPAPRRVQLRRGKEWRLGRDAVVVARPTRWGNPFALCVGVPHQPGLTGVRDRFTAVALYGAHVENLGDAFRSEARRQLGGKDLACWCPTDQPCHADVLLIIANQPEPMAALAGDIRPAGTTGAGR